mgnify:CR=1 FL=1
MFSTEKKQTLIQPKAANCGKKYHWIRTFSNFPVPGFHILQNKQLIEKMFLRIFYFPPFPMEKQKKAFVKPV